MAHLSITFDQEQINRHPLESTKVGMACKFSLTMKPPEKILHPPLIYIISNCQY